MHEILIVDDDPFFQSRICTLLRREGHGCTAVGTGEEGLSVVREGGCRVVVAGLTLPDMSGVELLTRVKQIDSAMEVIIVTSHGNTESAIAALKNGARDYLVKPVNNDEFLHAISLSLEQRRLLEENSELRALLKLFQSGQTIVNCIDAERLHEMIPETLAAEIGVARWIAAFPDGERLAVRGRRGVEEEKAQTILDRVIARDPPDQGQQCGVTRDMLSDPSQEILVCTIRSHGVCHGVILLLAEPGREPSPEQTKRLSFLLEQSALALENASRYSQARSLLYVDELTGLYNYRYLESALEHEIRRCERFGSGFSVIFLDIDLLKQVNDRHGHLVGSAVLKEMGRVLKRSLRDMDIIIRYGGDEFVVILVETNPDATSRVCERLRGIIESHPFLTDQGLDLRLTASLGYACYPVDTRSKRDLLEMADKAMYHSKHAGKNRVFHASVLLAGESGGDA